MRRDLRTPAVSVLAACGVALVAAGAGGQPPALRRNVDDYVVLAVRQARLPGIAVPGACNVGVDCAAIAAGSGRCGRLVLARGSFADGSQVAAAAVVCTRPALRLFQLFSNGASCGDAEIELFPPQPLATPIVPGTCDASCTPDVAALGSACGFPEPFPACAPSAAVSAAPDADCAGAADASPANGRCDLAPGAYGTVRVANGARLVLASGAYVFCGLLVGRNAEVAASGATIALPEASDLRVGNGGRVGFACGEVTLVLAGDGAAAIGRQARIAARLCAPERRLRVGTGAVLSGRFVADEVRMGRDVTATCCATDG